MSRNNKKPNHLDKHAYVSMIAALTLLTCIHSLAIAGNKKERPANRLTQSLRSTDTVSFYFLNRTGDYNYSASEFIEHASIQIKRRCGNNCAHFMRDVIRHLDAAKQTKCLSGQQNVIIDAGNKALIIYSHSGRHISAFGSCFFNPQPINEIVQRSDFIF